MRPTPASNACSPPLLVVSDLHLGRASTPKTAANDRHLAAFLDHHARSPTALGQPWTLILNGDVLDLIAVRECPSEASFDIAKRERRVGLESTPEKSAWKIDLIGERHRPVFQALCRFASQGNTLCFIRGNHEFELAWPQVQDAVRRAILEHTGPSDDPAELAQRIEFRERWEEPGRVRIEHGNAYDPSCASELTAAGEPCIPLSSLVLRHFAHLHVPEAVAEHADTWGIREFLGFFATHPSRAALLADYLTMVGHVVAEALRTRRLLAALSLFYLDRLLVLVAGAALAAGAYALDAPLGALAIALSTALAVVGLGRLRVTDSDQLLRRTVRATAEVAGAPLWIMGHTHRAVRERIGPVTYLNAGSWTSSRDGGHAFIRVEGPQAELLRFTPGEAP